MMLLGMLEEPRRRSVGVVDTLPSTDSASMRSVPDMAAEVVEISLQIVGFGERHIAAGHMAHLERADVHLSLMSEPVSLRYSDLLSAVDP